MPLRTDYTFLNFKSFFMKICLQFTCILSCSHKKKKKLGIPYHVYFGVMYFDYSWLLQENGISMCSNGKNIL
jgi:hypothetical protein